MRHREAASPSKANTADIGLGFTFGPAYTLEGSQYPEGTADGTESLYRSRPEVRHSRSWECGREARAPRNRMDALRTRLVWYIGIEDQEDRAFSGSSFILFLA
jgi:hypothetical protein